MFYLDLGSVVISVLDEWWYMSRGWWVWQNLYEADEGERLGSKMRVKRD